MLRATHLLYALVTLIGVFVIATVAGPQQASGEPLMTMIAGCEAEGPAQSCAAPTVTALASAQVRDRRLRPRADGAILRTDGG